MPVQIALAYNDEIATELEANGFRKKEVYIRHTGKSKSEGEGIFWNMRRQPFQFLVSDFWGAGPD